MDKDKKNIQQINIELDEKISSGEYANFVVVTHSPAEFVMDFTRLLPGVPKAKVHSRIIMAPQHAKAYLACLLYTSPSPRDTLLSRMPSSA